MKKGNLEIYESGLRKYGIDFLSDQLGHLDIQDLKDLHSLLSELLETETVKEPMGKYSKDTGHLTICSSQSGSPFDCHICNPTTPSNSEKEECCDGCKPYDGDRQECKWGDCPCHQTKEDFPLECEHGSTGRCGKCLGEEPTTETMYNVGRLCGVNLWIEGDLEMFESVTKKLGRLLENEEPTTPERQCCDCFGKEPIALGITLAGREFLCQCKCHQEKLPTSSYEVTCGRCEKSVKHSCGELK